jgi:hypothetical protein
MTKDEYDKKHEAIETEHTKKLHELRLEYAKSNSKYSIGDIVGDNSRLIKINTINYSVLSFWYPNTVYEGVMLTKKLKPFKNGERATIFNVTRHFPSK